MKVDVKELRCETVAQDRGQWGRSSEHDIDSPTFVKCR
jgi:hypothetical protein